MTTPTPISKTERYYNNIIQRKDKEIAELNQPPNKFKEFIRLLKELTKEDLSKGVYGGISNCEYGCWEIFKEKIDALVRETYKMTTLTPTKELYSGIKLEVTPLIISIIQRRNKIKVKVIYDYEMKLWRVDIR